MSGVVRIELGDCVSVMKRLAAEGVRVDSIVTDPPYHLSVIKHGSMFPGRRSAVKTGAKRGFMGKTWDGGDVAFRKETWEAAFAILKPGGYLLAFSGTRTYHRMTVAIEDAGFEVRDMIAWTYGSGFPKSHDVSKAIDKKKGAKRKVLDKPTDGLHGGTGNTVGAFKEGKQLSDEAVTPEAQQWSGWETALKPALEPVCVARKPMDGTVAENILKHGTGAMNIDACRTAGTKPQVTQGVNSNPTSFQVATKRQTSGDPNEGRWPANLVHDGSDEVVAMFPTSKSQRGEVTSKPGRIYRGGDGLPSHTDVYGFDDEGSAARFFYTAKAGKADRVGSAHATVKPTSLMRWLCRLVTQPGGLVLDPFAGSGSTLMAAQWEGFSAIGIEMDKDHVRDIRRKIGADGHGELFAGLADPEVLQTTEVRADRGLFDEE